MITELQKKIAQAIVNIFETGTVEGDYANVTSVKGDLGGLTYGRSQTTLMSGNLFTLIKMYCDANQAEFADDLRPYLDELKAKDISLNNNQTLHNLLRKAGRELIMEKTQDTFFDEVYWQPAVTSANKINVQTALGMAVVFDSIVHGSWSRRRNDTNTKFGSLSELGEKKWIKHYVDVRREWLKNSNPSTLLPKTVYRMDALKDLINNNNWDLVLPFTVREQTISEQTLPMKFRRLRLLSSFKMRGEDVRDLQKALVKAGIPLDDIDGIFGKDTDAAVKGFQKDKNLPINGIVEQPTRTALGL
jgi:chitosanase